MSKEQLRQSMRTMRNGLLLEADAAQHLTSLFKQHVFVNDDLVVAGYYPNGSELSPLPLLDVVNERGGSAALPVIAPNDRLLSFSKYRRDDQLIAGEYGILQPVIHQDIAPDVILCPMLAFDDQGYRLGQGGGYYDVTLEYYRSKKDVLVVGLAYAEQQCQSGSFDVEPHDQKLDMVLTPQYIKDFR